MSVSLKTLIDAIQKEANAVSAQMKKLKNEGSKISVVDMIALQLTMNKFSQIADLGSTTVSLFNQSFKTMISNVLR